MRERAREKFRQIKIVINHNSILFRQSLTCSPRPQININAVRVQFSRLRIHIKLRNLYLLINSKRGRRAGIKMNEAKIPIKLLIFYLQFVMKTFVCGLSKNKI